MSEWLPIETYDALKKKPEHAIFWVAESTDRRMRLSAAWVKTRYYGFRTVTHWMPLEPPKTKPEEMA